MAHGGEWVDLKGYWGFIGYLMKVGSRPNLRTELVSTKAFELANRGAWWRVG
ncbi:hypothetical protein Lfee_1692 [Legionella feeleii]|uniref:Uncharacterized protein n=1 Tax=Legionella feeleii TaxID=453 RepID=A0A0W0TMG0_9GAMM|nr:hypothetical protein Lfee_1692 [Legionella feeleii]SPX60548.1 Uncharacterised protein [Legionella feeleii]